jgi:hypothetical protein
MNSMNYVWLVKYKMTFYILCNIFYFWVKNIGQTVQSKLYIYKESKDTVSLSSQKPFVRLTQKVYQIIFEF